MVLTLMLLALFQSTLPVGGATYHRATLPLRKSISIHAPRGGSDCSVPVSDLLDLYFNPRSPWGERLQPLSQYHHQDLISIHAPRGGSDYGKSETSAYCSDFNPRSPWGERQHTK